MNDDKLNSIDLDCWDRLINDTIHLKRRVCCQVPNLDKIINELKNIAKSGNFTENSIKNKHYANALLNLWSTDEEFSKYVPIRRNLLEKVIDLNDNFVSLLMLYSLIDIYFFQYDNLQSEASFLIKYIVKELDRRAKGDVDSEIEIKHKYKNLLFDKKFLVHEKITSLAINHDVSLSTQLSKYNLIQSDLGRFYEKCRNCYYIKRVEAANLSECEPILEEVKKDKIYFKDYEDGKCVGHKLIHLLLLKLEENIFDIKKYQYVINFILNIAGDPRINHAAVNYQNWWLVLGNEDIAKMKKCLSGFDLELFLEIYGEFAEKENTHDQIRMFKERQKFLQGMMLQDLIHETKLFIGKNMVEYLRRKYNIKTLPTYYIIKDSPSMAVIYMKYNDSLFTEGCFNCKFRGYSRIIKGSPFYSKVKEYSYRDLGEGYFEQHSFGERYDKVHSGDWQTPIINYFMRISTKKLYSKPFYDGFKR